MQKTTEEGKTSSSVDSRLNFRNDRTDNEGACPLIIPRKEKNIKTKYEKTNTTRRKRPPYNLHKNAKA